MNKRKLLKLADLLEADAKNPRGIKFDIGTWARPADQYCSTTKAKIVPVDCGTAACAVGLACISGAFKGLSFNYVERGWGGFDLQPKYRPAGASRSLTGFDAVEKLFNISAEEADWLFTGDAYRHTEGARAEREVAKRIRAFVAGKASPETHNV